VSDHATTKSHQNALKAQQSWSQDVEKSQAAAALRAMKSEQRKNLEVLVSNVHYRTTGPSQIFQNWLSWTGRKVFRLEVPISTTMQERSL